MLQFGFTNCKTGKYKLADICKLEAGVIVCPAKKQSKRAQSQKLHLSCQAYFIAKTAAVELHYLGLGLLGLLYEGPETPIEWKSETLQVCDWVSYRVGAIDAIASKIKDKKFILEDH